jgi:dienelactone hydrolase
MRRAAAVTAVIGLLALPGSGSSAGATSVTLRVFRFVDHARVAHLRSGATVPRTLVTYVRVPAGRGPFPLVVFGHGYAAVPGLYAALLQSWARAGYVVAAPLFPLGNAHAPGGPDERDLINQPRDMSFVVSRLLGESRRPASPLYGAIDPRSIAVAGQSDGGETALAVAFEPRFRDRRVRAALILSGAWLPGSPLRLGSGGPALLATQGTADRINPPAMTAGFFAAAPRPKFLLRLLGAGHLPPYTTEQPQLGIVERVTGAFLDRYLRGRPLRPLLAAGNVRGVTALTADP